MLRKGVKIYKFINKRSALDVTSNLEYFKDRLDKDEREYKGNIVVSITSNKQYLKAYINKAKAKSIFQSIIDGNFTKLYPDGFKDYGGSIRDGQVIARTMQIDTKISPDPRDASKKKVQVCFTISEGPGKKTPTGAFSPIGKATTTVQSYLDPISMRECALEVIGYIQSAEIAGQLIGNPLHTFMSVSHENENEIGIQNVINSDDGIEDVLKKVESLSNQDLKKLLQAAQEEYKRRVQNYKQAN